MTSRLRRPRSARPFRFPLSLRWALLAAVAAPAAGGTLEAQSARPAPVAQQVASAVLPLPADMRAAATVMGYRTADDLVVLRAGTNGMRCLADDPKDKRFHVACYNDGLEPFMARGRALRKSGVTGANVDSVRFKEVESGTLPMPKGAAALYQMTDPAGKYDAVKNEIPDATSLYVIYIPGATVASTGLSIVPQQTGPWLMFPGTPKAHIMFTPSMR